MKRPLPILISVAALMGLAVVLVILTSPTERVTGEDLPAVGVEEEQADMPAAKIPDPPVRRPARKAIARKVLMPTKKFDDFESYRLGESIEAWKRKMNWTCKKQITSRKFERAYFCFQLLLSHDPKFADAHLGLGIAAASMGNREAAYWHYNDYLAFAPNGPRAKAVTQILAQFEEYQGIHDESADDQGQPEDPVVKQHLQQIEEGQELATKIQSTIEKYQSAIKSCAKNQAERDPTVTGTLNLQVTIGADGRASDVSVMSEEHQGTYAAGCVIYVYKQMKFPKFNNGTVVLEDIQHEL